MSAPEHEDDGGDETPELPPTFREMRRARGYLRVDFPDATLRYWDVTW
jgi:hypothetical protein